MSRERVIRGRTKQEIVNAVSPKSECTELDLSTLGENELFGNVIEVHHNVRNNHATVITIEINDPMALSSDTLTALCNRLRITGFGRGGPVVSLKFKR